MGASAFRLLRLDFLRPFLSQSECTILVCRICARETGRVEVATLTQHPGLHSSSKVQGSTYPTLQPAPRFKSSIVQEPALSPIEGFKGVSVLKADGASKPFQPFNCCAHQLLGPVPDRRSGNTSRNGGRMPRALGRGPGKQEARSGEHGARRQGWESCS